MRSLIVTAPGELGWADRPAPTLSSAAAAILRPLVVASCDFDHLIVSGKAPVTYPIDIGHEMVAEVVEVGDEVRCVSLGDTVVVPFQISCGACHQCLSGRTSSCAELPWLSCYGLGEAAGAWGGAAADLVAVPYADAMLVALPDGVAPEIAAAAGCNLTDAYRCVVPQLAAEPGAPVLVAASGFQNIGLACVAFARALGAERVDVLGLAPALAAKATSLGARVLGSAGDVEPGSYPITVDASLDPDLLVATLRATAPGGTCTVSAMYPEPLTPVPLLELFAACATVSTGQPHVRRDLESVLALLASGRVQADLLIDGTHPWDQAATAFGRPGKQVISRG
jgi:threonine dehydrogenase-like Zn-dependent dehydrogenase